MTYRYRQAANPARVERTNRTTLAAVGLALGLFCLSGCAGATDGDDTDAGSETTTQTIARATTTVAPTSATTTPASTTSESTTPQADSATAAAPPSAAPAVTHEAELPPAPPVAPVPAPVAVPEPTTVPPAPAPSSVYYKNCAQARAAGAAPLYEGSPGYRSGLDRDGDGVACE